MTQTFATDEKNDLFIGKDGGLSVASGIVAVENIAAQVAKTLLGEMILATDQGLPYFEAVWTGSPNLPQFEAAFRAAILAVDGVTGITSLTLQQVGDRLTYAAEIETVFGAGSVNG